MLHACAGSGVGSIVGSGDGSIVGSGVAPAVEDDRGVDVTGGSGAVRSALVLP